ncbi:hypothetical protein [Thermotoga sp.]|nr:hypothetical protein [Thermotoga sp.]
MKPCSTLMFLVITAIGFAQADLSLLLPKEYPVPEWVKPVLW